jgi:3-oxoacyl-[acyl-carrier protein] reductase
VGTLADKVAIVSGSGRGIGRAIALKLASEGARVVVNDIDVEPAELTVKDIQDAGGVAVACPGSVTAPDFGQRFVETAVREFGGLDIIVNNAGYTWDTVVQKMTDEQWDAILDVHLKAPFRILRAAQPHIRDWAKAEQAANGQPAHRRVVNISSVAGVWGNPGQVNYSAAKSGVLGLTKTLSKEWGRYNVTVNAVAFGLIRTRLTSTPAGDGQIEIDGNMIKVGLNPDLMTQLERGIPLGRAGTPQEAAGAVYLFCSPESSYISGQTIVCGGGFVG